MFCKYCGAELPEGSKFCQMCGMELEGTVIEAPEAQAPAQEAQAQAQEAQAPAQEAQAPVQEAAAPVQEAQAPVKKSKKGLIIGLAAGGGALVILLLLLFLVILPLIRGGKEVEVDLKQYVTADFYGYDMVGDADVLFDTEKFFLDFDGKVKYRRGHDLSYDPIEMLVDSIYCDMDYEYRTLKNGEKVTCVISVDPRLEEILNIDIIDLEDGEDTIEIPFTVSGLDEVELIDPFEYIEIMVEGISPYAELDYTFNNAPEVVNDNLYFFGADKYYDLANGDVVTIEFDDWYDNSYLIEQYGVGFSKRAYEYTVEGLPELLTESSQLSDSDIDYMKTVGDSVEEIIISNNPEDIGTNGYEMVGYILKVSEIPSEYSSSNNMVSLIYKYDGTVTDLTGTYPPEDFTIYQAIQFNNVVIEDGKLVLDEDNPQLPWHYYYIELSAGTLSGERAYLSLDEVKADLINDSDSYNTYEYVEVK